MKALAWILTAAAILIGADVFVMSSEEGSKPTDGTRIEQGPITLAGGIGAPTPPPDAY